MCRHARRTEWAGGEPRELARVAILERDRHAVRGEVLKPDQRIGREARLGLLAVGDHRRAGRLELLDRVAKRLLVQAVKLL